jgi:hypothetical protein
MTTHGAARNHRTERLYWVWVAMRKKARIVGTPIAREWNDYLAFKRDMSERPQGFVLARIDPTVGYQPGNCIWTTRSEQKRLLTAPSGEQSGSASLPKHSGIEAEATADRQVPLADREVPLADREVRGAVS